MPLVSDGVVGLANYNSWLHYKSGKTNVEADALSRIDWDRVKERVVNCDSMDSIAVKPILAGCTIQKVLNESCV